MNDVLVNIENLYLGYAGVNLVKDLNMSIRAGEFWSIIGPNGQGKSTFIKAFLGLNTPIEGKINFSGIKRKQIAYVPQSSAVNPNLPITAKEFVAIATKGLPFSKSRRQKIDEAFNEVQLSDKMNRNYWTLSGGERQRLHIARALVHSPSFLILDEPDTGLDFVSMENLLTLLLELREKRQMTVMMITHNLKTAERVSDKCALFSQGAVAHGSTDEVLTRTNIQQAFMGVNARTIDLWLGEDAKENA